MSEELCPKCGTTVSELNELTGWCAPCSTSLVCLTCGREYRKGAHCHYCTSAAIRYKERIADLREEGTTAKEALKIVRDEVRPKCAVCGEPIARSRKDSLICRQTPRCIEANRVFRAKRRKRIPRETALQETLREIHGKA